MSELTVTLICAVVGSQALLEIVKAIIKAISNHFSQNPVQMGIKWLLQDRLERIITTEIQKGETSRRTRKYVNQGYKYYHALKGNGDMDQLLEDYRNLVVRY